MSQISIQEQLLECTETMPHSYNGTGTVLDLSENAGWANDRCGQIRPWLNISILNFVKLNIFLLCTHKISSNKKLEVYNINYYL